MRKFVALLFALPSTLALALSCGSEGSAFGPSDFQEAGSDAPVSYDADDPGPVFGNLDSAPPCKNLECHQVTCDAGGTTSISGAAYDPAGKVPLYNVVIYIPNTPVAPITTGASCDRCGTLSGDPLVTAITGPDGRFKLDNVPVGVEIPLVIQVGKWRRQIKIPTVQACTNTHINDAQVIRLPRSKTEGDLPQMALASGRADPFECLLVKMGLDLGEFTPNTGPGRVHYYRENGIDTSPASPAASTLYGNLARMKGYDIIFLPCEGSERDKPAAADQNLVDYTGIGGRVFTTHYGYTWLHLGAQPFPTTGNWQPRQSDHYSSVLPTMVNQSFPKGAAFAQWLVNVGASSSLGSMGISEGRHDLNAANEPPSTTWMTTTSMPAPNTNATMHFTANTPLNAPEAEQCGRLVYSDFHVSASALTTATTFPASCKTGDLSAQEKALEFMLFDLSSCIQTDKAPPEPPPVIR
jgi:hypothetical protein